jgi:hypothetical protein
MALHLTNRNVAHEIATRIRRLIARKDNGDVTAAARRLDRPIADLCHPERVIASTDEPAALEFLANVVRSYGTDATWLITGTNARNALPIPSDARVTIVEVLAELSDHLLDEVRSEREGPLVSRGVPAPSPSSDSRYRRTPLHP